MWNSILVTMCLLLQVMSVEYGGIGENPVWESNTDPVVDVERERFSSDGSPHDNCGDDDSGRSEDDESEIDPAQEIVPGAKQPASSQQRNSELESTPSGDEEGEVIESGASPIGR